MYMSMRHLLNSLQLPGISYIYHIFHCVKSLRIRSFSCLYLKYGREKLRMQTLCISNTDTVLNYTTANCIREYRSVCSKQHHIIMLSPSKFEGLETTIFDFLRVILKTNSSQTLFNLLVCSKCNLELPDLKKRLY